jgi:hypothetical protein
MEDYKLRDLRVSHTHDWKDTDPSQPVEEFVSGCLKNKKKSENTNTPTNTLHDPKSSDRNLQESQVVG